MKPVIGRSEFAVVSVILSKLDEMIAEMKGCPTVNEDPANIDTKACFSDKEFTFTEDDFDVSYGGNDLGSLTGESYIRSGQLSEHFKPVGDEFAEDKRPPKKRVQFASNARGKILCQEYKNFNPIQKCQHELVWYKRDDLKRFRDEKRKEAFAAWESSFTSDCRVIYETCESSEKLRFLNQNSTTAVSVSECRGFESVTVCHVTHANRKSIIKQVLKTQQQHAAYNIMTADERAEELGNMSRTLTKVSRRLAYLLGSGDSVVARKMVSQKELKRMVKDHHIQWKTPSAPLDSIDNLFEV